MLIKLYIMPDGSKLTRPELARALNISEDYLAKHILFFLDYGILRKMQERKHDVRGKSAFLFNFDKTSLQKYIRNDPLFRLFLDDLVNLNWNLSLFDE